MYACTQYTCVYTICYIHLHLYIRPYAYINTHIHTQNVESSHKIVLHALQVLPSTPTTGRNVTEIDKYITLKPYHEVSMIQSDDHNMLKPYSAVNMEKTDESAMTKPYKEANETKKKIIRTY